MGQVSASHMADYSRSNLRDLATHLDRVEWSLRVAPKASVHIHVTGNSRID